MVNSELIKKHQFAIDCAIKYYIKNEPTGVSDSEYDKLEKDALNDGLSIRDYVLSQVKGNRIKNKYVESIPKEYSENSMYDSISDLLSTHGDIYVEPKYDGSGIVCYYEDGNPITVVTCGGSNKSSDEGGVDQTSKLLRYFPKVDPSIKAIQCELLVESNASDRPRQLGNGIVNSKDKYTADELDDLVCIRGFRYFSDKEYDFMKELKSFPKVSNHKGTLYNFSPGYVMRVSELLSLGREVVNNEVLRTSTGTFLIDGYVFYTLSGEVLKAIKFKNAGGQEAVEVDYIQWNDLSDSKDGFSSNVMLKTGVDIRGSIVKKPSSNGVNNLLSKNISKGAMVSVTLRGSTIPCVDKVFKVGNGDFNFPVCKCGTKLGSSDIYGNNLKCPNPYCTSRMNRMRKYLDENRFSFTDPKTYNGLFIIDRFKFEDKILVSHEEFSDKFRKIINDSESIQSDLLNYFLSNIKMTPLQEKNLRLVCPAVYKVLREYNKNN